MPPIFRRCAARDSAFCRTRFSVVCSGGDEPPFLGARGFPPSLKLRRTAVALAEAGQPSVAARLPASPALRGMKGSPSVYPLPAPPATAAEGGWREKKPNYSPRSIQKRRSQPSRIKLVIVCSASRRSSRRRPRAACDCTIPSTRTGTPPDERSPRSSSRRSVARRRQESSAPVDGQHGCCEKRVNAPRTSSSQTHMVRAFRSPTRPV